MNQGFLSEGRPTYIHHHSVPKKQQSTRLGIYYINIQLKAYWFVVYVLYSFELSTAT
jgi:hypothetical protein